jgi:hypothetical protein
MQPEHIPAALYESLKQIYIRYPIEGLLWLIDLCLGIKEKQREAQEALTILEKNVFDQWRASNAVTPLLEGLLAFGLSHPEPNIRERCASSFSALSFYKSSKASQPDSLQLLAPLLTDEVAAVALSAARQLWLLSRAGASVEPVQSALEMTSMSGAPNVAYFASLALSHESYRKRQGPITLSTPDGEPDISGVWRKDNYHREHNSHHFDKKSNTEKIISSICRMCGAPQTKLIYEESDGDISGGTNYATYHCERCEKYTHTEHDWG